MGGGQRGVSKGGKWRVDARRRRSGEENEQQHVCGERPPSEVNSLASTGLKTLKSLSVSPQAGFCQTHLTENPRRRSRQSGEDANLLGASQMLIRPISVREPSERDHNRWNR